MSDGIPPAARAGASPSAGSPGAWSGRVRPARAGVSWLAIASLVLALLGLAGAVGGMLFGVAVTPFPSGYRSPAVHLELVSGVVIAMGFGACLSWALSVPAIITGHLALAAIRRSGGALSGRPVARAGLVLGYLAAAAPILTIALSFVLYIVAVSG